MISRVNISKRHRNFSKEDLYSCGIILVIVSCLFSFSCNFPLLNAWDDDMFVIMQISRFKISFANVGHFFIQPVYNNYVPLTMFSYMLDYNLWGTNGLGYHLQSLFWHLIAVFGVYSCFRFFKLSPLGALFLSLVFAVYPQRVESVVWVSERRDVMCGAFYFWSFFFYIRMGARKRFPLASFLLFICALLSKGMAVTLPAVLVLYEMHRAKSFFAFKRFWKTIPYFVFSCAIIIVTALVFPKDLPPYNLWERLFIVVFNVPWYFERSFWPGVMSPLYPNVYISSGTILNAVLFYLLTPLFLLGVFLLNRRYFLFRLLLILAAYLVALSPAVGLFRVASGSFDYADRYSYIPAFFFLLGIACLIELLSRQTRFPSFYFIKTKHFKNILRSFISICIAVFCGISYYYAKTWRSYKDLISSASLHEPANWMALSAFAIYSSKEGDLEEMELCADRILDLKGIVSKKDQISALIMGNYLKGISMRLSNQEGRDLEYFERAAEEADKVPEPLRGVYVRLFSMMAESYLRKGEKDRAFNACNWGLNCLGWKKTAGTYFLEGNKFMIRGQYKYAVMAFSAAHEMEPESGMYMESLKKAQRMLKKGPESKNRIPSVRF